MKYLFYILLIPFYLFSVCSTAQTKLSVKETGEISYQAKNAISELEQLLNFVTFSDNAPNELADVIEKSYTPNARNQIFYDKTVVIEDDTDPDFHLNKTKDLPVDKYIHTLDIYYSKSIDPSIIFSNIRVSDVKKKDYYYVKLIFDCEFKGQNTKKSSPYKLQTRQATIRAEKNGNRWKAFIYGITFYDPRKPFDTKENNVIVTSGEDQPIVLGNKETSDNQIAVKEAVDKVALARAEEEKKAKEAAYNDAIRIANTAMENNDYQTALDAYHKAIEYNSFAPLPRLQIQKIERDFKHRLESLIQTAEGYQKSRSYDDALTYYRKALEAQPEASARIQPQISLLTNRISEIVPIRTKIETGHIAEAISDCDELIRQKNKQKVIKDYPDLYLLRAQCYVRSSQRNAYTKALDDFSEAITLDPLYLDAYLTRATYYENRKELDKAVIDYDYITTRILPNEAKYYLKKARLKEQLGLTKQAVADYDKAIQLAPNNPLYHLQKGMLEYRNHDLEAARHSYSQALNLNVTYTEAYYQRGIAFADQQKIEEAAADFRKAQKLGGADSLTVRFLRAKSNEYHNIGATALRNRDTKKSDNMFTLALALDPNNNSVWISRGDSYYEKKDYKKALEYYNTATLANSRNSEGYYKKGLALMQLKQNKEALANFNTALQYNNTYLDVYKSIGDVLLAMNQITQATANYQRLIEVLLPVYQNQQKKMQVDASLKQNLAELYAEVAKCQNQLQAYANAVQSADQSLTYDPLYAEAYYQRGIAYQALKQYTNAAEALSRAVRQKPNYLPYQYTYGMSALKAEKYTDAIAAFTQVLALDNEQSIKDTRYLRGVSFYHQNKIEEALQDFILFAVKNPNEVNPKFYTYYGLAHLHKKQTNAAAKHLQKAYSLNKMDGFVLLGMACLASEQNKPQEAIQWLKKAFQSRKLEYAALRKEEDLLRSVRTGSTYAEYIKLKKMYFPNSY
ncbi:tetratricopeptide repeat protein [Cytophagaceae bacterium YF14B1]|uniref:Tetratricopeptide repeat protein n=1 Tax=Xanthocytophaga flava TaxID=3048013 RepID=A0AAE3UBJ9_9BACT|nr:tetratricopeptide repeat protein [Xanthocytophaga flavus]MDJ1483859.1 tetratricopeptide repeat protein [Xanthocytophaga flavus]